MKNLPVAPNAIFSACVMAVCSILALCLYDVDWRLSVGNDDVEQQNEVEPRYDECIPPLYHVTVSTDAGEILLDKVVCGECVVGMFGAWNLNPELVNKICPKN